MLKREIPSFLCSLNVSYFEYGVIKQGKKKVYDYYKVDKLTDDQKVAILEKFPSVVFKVSSPSYAPEIKRGLICFPVGKL